MPTFLPQDSLQTPRFCGITTFMRVPHAKALDGVDVAVVGIPFDTGSPFRVGSRFGPSAIPCTGGMNGNYLYTEVLHGGGTYEVVELPDF